MASGGSGRDGLPPDVGGRRAQGPGEHRSDAARGGQRAHLNGAAGEEIALRAYRARGCICLAQRWRCAAGEIDLVLRDGEEVVFAEVKTARRRDTAAARIAHAQMARIAAAASVYLAQMPQGQLTAMRFDVVLVFGTGDVEIIENAFGLG